MDSLSGIAAPDEARLASRYADIAAGLERTDSAAGWRAGFDEWDGLRRDWKSWANLTRLRYSQDTRRDEYREAQCELDRRTPTVSALDTAMKRRFLASPKRAALERELGPHLGLRVTLEPKKHGGALTLHYGSLDQLEPVLRLLRAR